MLLHHAEREFLFLFARNGPAHALDAVGVDVCLKLCAGEGHVALALVDKLETALAIDIDEDAVHRAPWAACEVEA